MRCKKIPFIKVSCIRHAFEVKRGLPYTKNRNLFASRLLVSTKGKERDKRKVVTRFVDIIVIIIFIQKFILNSW